MICCPYLFRVPPTWTSIAFLPPKPTADHPFAVSIMSNIIVIDGVKHKPCGRCKEVKPIDRDHFYNKLTRYGKPTFDFMCIDCRQVYHAERYQIDKEIKESSLNHSGLMSLPGNSGFNADQVCSKCVFLRECNYLVKVAKSTTDPYCFKTSKLHVRFVAYYGKKANTVLGDENGLSNDDSDEIGFEECSYPERQSSAIGEDEQPQARL